MYTIVTDFGDNDDVNDGFDPNDKYTWIDWTILTHVRKCFNCPPHLNILPCSLLQTLTCQDWNIVYPFHFSIFTMSLHN